MDWGLIAGLAALAGVFMNFVRIGHWQGSMESRVKSLEQASSNALTKFDAISQVLDKNTVILTELKTRLDLIFDEKRGRRLQ